VPYGINIESSTANGLAMPTCQDDILLSAALEQFARTVGGATWEEPRVVPAIFVGSEF